MSRQIRFLHDLDPESPDTAPFVRQFQTLTHPGMLGSKFHILEFTKDAPLPDSNPFRFDPNGLTHLRANDKTNNVGMETHD